MAQYCFDGTFNKFGLYLLFLDCLRNFFLPRERQMNAAFQQEAGQGDFGRWERFGLNYC